MAFSRKNYKLPMELFNVEHIANLYFYFSEKKMNDSSKKRSFGVKLVNKSVMDELTNVLKRSTNEQTENPNDGMTAYGSSTSTSEGVDPNGRDESLSSGDSVLKMADESSKSEFAIPVPPPMPPLQDIENNFGLP